MADKPKSGMSDMTFLVWIIAILFGIWLIWVYLDGPEEFEKTEAPFLAPPVGEIQIN